MIHSLMYDFNSTTGLGRVGFTDYFDNNTAWSDQVLVPNEWHHVQVSWNDQSKGMLNVDGALFNGLPEDPSPYSHRVGDNTR